MSNSSSSNSLNLAGGPVRGVVRSRQSSVTGSNENLEVTPALPLVKQFLSRVLPIQKN